MVVWFHQPAATIRSSDLSERGRRQGLYGKDDPIYHHCLGCQEFREAGVRPKKQMIHDIKHWFWRLICMLPRPGGAWCCSPQVTSSVFSLPANRLVTLHGMFGLCLIFWGVAINQGEKVVNKMLADWRENLDLFPGFVPRPHGFPMEDTERLSYSQRIQDKLSQRFYSNVGADDIADFFSDAPMDTFRRSPSWSKKKLMVEILPKETIQHEADKKNIVKMPIHRTQGGRKTCDLSSCELTASVKYFADLFGTENRPLGSPLTSSVAKKMEYYNQHFLLESPKNLPSFSVFLGNVSSINALRGTQRRHPDVAAVRREQHAALHSIMKKISRRIPVFAVPGPGDMSQDPRMETILDWESQFGRSIFSVIRGNICHLYLNSTLINRPGSAWKEFRILFDWWNRNLRICEENRFPIFLYSYHSLDAPKSIAKKTGNFDVPTQAEATRDAQVAFYTALEGLTTPVVVFHRAPRSSDTVSDKITHIRVPDIEEGFLRIYFNNLELASVVVKWNDPEI